MTLIPELEKQLHKAATRMKDETEPAPIGKGRLARPVLRGALAVVCGFVVTGSALAATGVWSPTIGKNATGGKAEISATEVPLGIERDLLVLKRDQRAIDRGAAVQKTLDGVGRNEIDGIRTESIRYLGSAPGNSAVILATAETAEAPSAIGSMTGKNPVCVYRPIVAGGTPPGACWSLSDINRNRALASASGPFGSITYGVVPNRVDYVRAHLSDGSVRVVNVKKNYLEIKLPKKLNLRRVVWNDWKVG